MSRKFTLFRPRIRSRHPSHNILRKGLPLMPFRSVVRLGSTTVLRNQVSSGGDRIEINTVQSIKNASNKLLMKKCFKRENIKTAEWYVHIRNGNELIFRKQFPTEEDDTNLVGWEDFEMDRLPYPMVAKHIYGSRGKGNTLINSKEELMEWVQGKTLGNYILEKFYSYSREYRLHVTEEGCFYTCRKMLKSDTPENQRWFRNDSNSVWVVEENESFDKPVNWDDVIEESVKALKAVGLDFGAVDLKIQTKFNKDGELRENPKFIIIEINSAPSFGELTAQKYIEEIPKLLNKKYKQYENSFIGG